MSVTKGKLLVLSFLTLALVACEQEKAPPADATTPSSAVPEVTQKTPVVKTVAPVFPATTQVDSPEDSIAQEIPATEMTELEKHKAERRAEKLKQRRWWDDQKFDELNLDIEQKAAMETQLQSLMQQEKQLKQERLALRQQYRDAVANADLDSVTNIMQQKVQLKCRNKRMRTDTAAQILYLLSSEQKALLTENPEKLKRVLKAFSRGGAD